MTAPSPYKAPNVPYPPSIMRPLIVLLLVGIAGASLWFGLKPFLEDSPTSQSPVGPSAVHPEPTKPPPGQESGSEPREVEGPTRDSVAVPAATGGTRSEVAVSGSTGNSLVGTVHNEQGAAVPGVRVRMSRDAFLGEQVAFLALAPRRQKSPIVEGKSDANGRYVLRNVPAGNGYYVLFEHADYKPLQESQVRIGDEGEFRGPDCVLTKGSSMHGFVRDTGNNPVANAKLRLVSAYNMSMSMEDSDIDAIGTASDAFGHYEFKNVPAGPRNLVVQADGYGSQVIQNQNFTGSSDENRELDIQFDVGQPLQGRVVDTEGIAVADAQVIAVNFQNQITSRGEARSKADGQFAINDLRAGNYIVMVQAKGYSQARVNRVQSGTLDVVVEVKRQASVPGRVLADGAPVANFRVAARRTTPPATPGTAQIFEETEISEVVANSTDGQFLLQGFEPGYYVLYGEAEGYAPTQGETFQVLDGQTPSPQIVNLTAGGSISARVLDASGAPVARAIVRSMDNDATPAAMDPFMSAFVSGTGTEREARTDSQGNFRLTNLSPGLYRIEIEHPQHCSESLKDVHVNDGQETRAGDLTLRDGGAVRGAVLDAAGRAMPSGYVQMFSTTDPGLSYQMRTDGEGRFEIDHVRPGSYRISATRRTSTDTNDAFETILDQQTSEVVISVTDGSVVSRNLNLGS